MAAPAVIVAAAPATAAAAAATAAVAVAVADQARGALPAKPHRRRSLAARPTTGRTSIVPAGPPARRCRGALAADVAQVPACHPISMRSSPRPRASCAACSRQASAAAAAMGRVAAGAAAGGRCPAVAAQRCLRSSSQPAGSPAASTVSSRTSKAWFCVSAPTSAPRCPASTITSRGRSRAYCAPPSPASTALRSATAPPVPRRGPHPAGTDASVSYLRKV